MRILYVEDNPANLFLVKRVARGHEVISYVDGEEALRNIERDRPDLILMDIQLAGTLNGLEVVKSLREKGIKTPIVAVTAYAMVGDRERCLAAGCDDYIPKPLPIAQLVAIITEREQILNASREATREAAAVMVEAAAPHITPPAEVAPAAEPSTPDLAVEVASPHIPAPAEIAPAAPPTAPDAAALLTKQPAFEDAPGVSAAQPSVTPPDTAVSKDAQTPF